VARRRPGEPARLPDDGRRAAPGRGLPQRRAASALETHGEASDSDDSLTVLLRCCHAKLMPPSHVALTTAENARAFLVPEATIARGSAVAVAMVDGPQSALPQLDALTTTTASMPSAR
jgi:predicted RNA polymerase sigma factor